MVISAHAVTFGVEEGFAILAPEEGFELTLGLTTTMCLRHWGLYMTVSVQTTHIHSEPHNSPYCLGQSLRGPESWFFCRLLTSTLRRSCHVPMVLPHFQNHCSVFPFSQSQALPRDLQLVQARMCPHCHTPSLHSCALLGTGKPRPFKLFGIK